MLSNISKVELAERAKKMRVAANVTKDSSLEKRKIYAGFIQVQSEQDEHTASGIVFKRRRLEEASPTTHTRMV